MSLNANIRTMITNLVAASVSPTCKIRRNIKIWISINDPNGVYKIMEDICCQIEKNVNEQNPHEDFSMLGKRPSEMKKFLENRYKMAIKPMELLGRAVLILSFYGYGLSTPSVSDLFLEMCTRLNASDQTTLTCLLSALLFDGDNDRKTTINTILISEDEHSYDKNCPYSSLSDLMAAVDKRENGQSTEQGKQKEKTMQIQNSNGKGSTDGKKKSIKSPDVINDTECKKTEDDQPGKYQSDDEPFGWNTHTKEALQSENGKDVIVGHFQKQETKPQTENRSPTIQESDSKCKMLKEELIEKEKLLENTNRRLKEMSEQSNKLNIEIKKLRTNTRALENDLEERNKNCSHQILRIAELTKQNENLTEDLRLTKGKNGDLSQKENELKSLAKDAQVEVMKLQKHQTEILEKLSEKENRLIDHKRKLKEVSEQNNDLNAQNTQLKRKQKLTEYDIEQKNKKYATLSSELEEMTKKNQDLKTKLSSIQQEKEMGVSKTEREMHYRINESQQKISKLERSLKAANEKLDTKVKALVGMENQLEKVRKQNEEMVAESQANGQLINDLNAKLNQLKEINEQNEITRKSRDREIVEVEVKLKAELDMAEKKVQQFLEKEIKWKTDKRSLELKLQKIMGKLEHLEQSRNLEENTGLIKNKEENLRLQGCLENAKTDISDLKTKYEYLYNELREKNTKLAEGSMKLENLLVQNGELLEKVETIQKKYDCVLSDNQDKSITIQRQERKIDKLKAELRDNISVNAVHQYEMIRKLNSQMIVELKKNKIEKKKLLTGNKDLENHARRYRKRVTVLEQSQEELKSQIIKQTKDFEDANNRAQHRLRLFERSIRRLVNNRTGNSKINKLKDCELKEKDVQTNFIESLNGTDDLAGTNMACSNFAELPRQSLGPKSTTPPKRFNCMLMQSQNSTSAPNRFAPSKAEKRTPPPRPQKRSLVTGATFKPPKPSIFEDQYLTNALNTCRELNAIADAFDAIHRSKN
ncbi:hypothetical protein ACOME3_008200 [Neoechinorhynchus agilis]